ncbi:hypothetical protein JCM15519_01230 [Fundidesulfovibrio butyratiphilus]
MTALLSGSSPPPPGPCVRLGNQSVMSPALKKSKPWIGPNGGMIGLGIKTAGDWCHSFRQKSRRPAVTASGERRKLK